VYPAGRHAAEQHLPQIATATDNGGDEIGQLMFVVGDNGPLGYTPVGNSRPEPMIIAALVEQFNEQYGR
jgi:hypothetical protein